MRNLTLALSLAATFASGWIFGAMLERRDAELFAEQCIEEHVTITVRPAWQEGGACI